MLCVTFRFTSAPHSTRRCSVWPAKKACKRGRDRALRTPAIRELLLAAAAMLTAARRRGSARRPSRLAKSTARVVGIPDGDAIPVLHSGREVRVRLNGIDAPEKAYRTRAKEFAADVVFGRTVGHSRPGHRPLRPHRRRRRARGRPRAPYDETLEGLEREAATRNAGWGRTRTRRRNGGGGELIRSSRSLRSATWPSPALMQPGRSGT